MLPRARVFEGREQQINVGVKYALELEMREVKSLRGNKDVVMIRQVA